MNPDDFAYKKLGGKRVTHREFAQKIATLTMGDISKSIPPMIQSEIMQQLGFKDKKSIRQYLNLAKELNLFDESKKDDFNIKEYKFLAKMEDFIKKPEIDVWCTFMDRKARGGKSFLESSNKTNYLRNLKHVCDTLGIEPLQLISGGSTLEILENGRTYMTNFVELYFQKKSTIKYFKNWSSNRINKVTFQYGYSKAVRDFMKCHSYSYPDGESGVMSQSISTFHGNYSDVRMTISEYRKGKEYIKAKWGIDSDIFRWFSVGVEAFPRKSALHQMTTAYTKVTYKNREFYSMFVIEKKTSHYKKGKWDKLIFDDDTKKSIDLVLKRGENYIIEERKLITATNDIYPKLKEVYKYLNKTHLQCRIQDDQSTSYFLEHCSHALRHCGGQIWLIMTKWNLDFVASMGWKKVQELSDSYGEMPAEMKLEILEDLRF